MAQNHDENDFWDLGDFRKNRGHDKLPSFSKNHTSAVDVIDFKKRADNYSNYISKSGQSTSAVEIQIQSDGNTNTTVTDSQITKFIPPHSNTTVKNKHILFEYVPQNPLIKNVRVISEKPNDNVFVEDNLFIRERSALLHRTVNECDPVPFYSYSPRYSQLNKAQLKWYLWWRENTRNGIFLKTDESYVILYAYELAASDQSEDTQAALSMLCSLLTEYSNQELGIVLKMMIRDIICDFCLLHNFPSPIDKLIGVDRQIINGSFLPEFFVDLSKTECETRVDPLISSLSIYDYRRSKFYNNDTAYVFHRGVRGALSAVMRNVEAFAAITSFTNGVYGSVTLERKPFIRMVNIVNKNIRLEVTYYEMSNLQPAITDIVRYCENKIREHLGIRNKINVLSINPVAKNICDGFFANNMPARPTVDRRRKDRDAEIEASCEYNDLYDVPKTEIDPSRAAEIERESWQTTKILTEAFTDNTTEQGSNVFLPLDDITDITQPQTIEDHRCKSDCNNSNTGNDSQQELPTTFSRLRSVLGDVSEFILLCISNDADGQRKFANSRGCGIDELADRINEVALDIIGDIILDSDGLSYTVIEDYKDLFENI